MQVGRRIVTCTVIADGFYVPCEQW